MIFPAVTLENFTQRRVIHRGALANKRKQKNKV